MDQYNIDSVRFFGDGSGSYLVRQYKKRSPSFRAVKLMRSRFIKWLCDTPHKKIIRILDAGAGTGAITSLPLIFEAIQREYEAKLYLTDITKETLEATRSLSFEIPYKLKSRYDNWRELLVSSEYICADIAQMPFKDKFFDVVISGFTLHHLSDGDKMRASLEMQRVLSDGGFFALADLSLSTRQEEKAICRANKDGVNRAKESYVSLSTQTSYLPDIDIKKGQKRKRWFWLWGTKTNSE